jgi:nucleoside-triphosphatase
MLVLSEVLLGVGFLNIFITGPPGSGKTTVIKRVMEVLEAEGFRAGGLYCPEIRESGTRLGFEIIDVLSGARGILSHILQPTGPRIGKYRVNLEALSRIGVRAIETAVEIADYVVIDEVGPMELQAQSFQLAVMRALESSKPVIGILHWKLRHPIKKRITARQDVQIYPLTRENRTTLPRILLSDVHEILTPKDGSS